MSIGLQELKAEPEILILGRMNNQARKVILAWIDHMIIFGDDSDIERSSKQRFRIKTLRYLDYFVVMKVARSGSKSGSLHISQTVYIQKVL